MGPGLKDLLARLTQVVVCVCAVQKKEKKKEEGERSKEGGEATTGDGDTDDVVATMDNLNIEDALALGKTTPGSPL